MVRLKSKLAALLMAVAMAVSLVACGVNITSVGLPESATIQKGDTLQMNVNYGTENQAEADAIAKAAEKLELVWESNNEKVATVDENGLVTAVGSGSADITVSVADGNLSSSCTITVVVPAEGVVVPEELELTTNGSNKTADLNAKATPEDATNVTFSYESSNEQVATVDETGLVTAISNGEADITTTMTQSSPAATGENATGESAEETILLTATTHVIVTTAVESITFDNTEGILTVGNSHTIEATVSPEAATNQTLTWASSDENVATVDETGKITAKAVGNATITANAGNVSATYEVTVQQITCSYCGATGHTSSSCPVKAADQKAAAQAAAEAAAQQQAAAAAAAQQQAAVQASGGGSTTSGGSSSGGSSGGTSAPAPAPAPAPDPGPSDSGGSSDFGQGQGGSLGGEVITGGGNGVGVDAP